MNSVTIHGVVTRKPYTSDKFAAFSVRPNQDRGAQRSAPILDVVVFDADPLVTARLLDEGVGVSIAGHLGSKKATAKDRSVVQVDGRDLWVMQLVADKIDALDGGGSQGRARPRSDDDIGF